MEISPSGDKFTAPNNGGIRPKKTTRPVQSLIEIDPGDHDDRHGKEAPLKNQDRNAGYALLEVGTLVGFRNLKTDVEQSLDGKNLYVRVLLRFGDKDEDEPADLAEWASFGFIFVLAVLSFADARPRGISSVDYVEKDEFGVDDFFNCLRFERGALRFSADYIRGRSMKTDITVKPDGTVTVTTRGRGKALLRWLDRMQGKKIIQPV